MSEVVFSPDARSTETSGDGLSVSEYVAIGISSVLLGLIYVASVFLYLHLRKRKKEKKPAGENKSLASVEEGVVKNNPLLGLGRHFNIPEQYSDSASSDTDKTPDIIRHHDDRKKNVSLLIKKSFVFLTDSL